MKPRIRKMRIGASLLWACTDGDPARGYGWGATPKQAYRDWSGMHRIVRMDFGPLRFDPVNYGVIVGTATQ